MIANNEIYSLWLANTTIRRFDTKVKRNDQRKAIGFGPLYTRLDTP